MDCCSSRASQIFLLVAALRVTQVEAAVVGLTADLEMWPQDSKYLHVTATAAAAVRRGDGRP